MDVNISQLVKTYPGGIQALRGVNLEIGTGTFGLLGSNGAGKTTLLRILATLLKPSQGRVTVDGFDVSDRRQKWAVKQILGYLPEEPAFYPSLSVSEFLDYIATLKNLHHPRRRAGAVEQVVEQAGLKAVTRQRIGTLSGGMKRRVGIAQALLGDPKLLIVDEPTAWLDPEERVRFRNLLARLSTGCLVILSTHIVEDIAATCQDMAVLHRGQVRFRGSPAMLIREAEGQVWELELPNGREPSPEWQISSRVQEDGGLKLRLVGANPSRNARPVKPTLEEAYLALMGKVAGQYRE
jgi:ABC-2 type transport system ATP-binding protein